MLIKKDKNEQLEKVLESKEINEQAKNLLQGILYKIEVSYKDYKKVKTKNQTKEQYVEQLIDNIEKRCGKITVVKPRQKITDEKVQKELEKKGYYVGEEIISYPIEQKILYAIEKKSRNSKILNNKYGDVTTAISNMINEGKTMDRTEVIRDFNGWSWTTINKEIENIEANLIYQILQIELGEDFLDNWCEDKDGIIDYLEVFVEEVSQKYGNDIATQQKDLLIKIAMANTAKENQDFMQNIIKNINEIDAQIKEYENSKQKILDVSNHRRQLLKELSIIEKIVGQDSRLKEEYQKRNEEAPIDKKIFNIKIFKKQLLDKKQEILEQIEKCNYILKPSNYLKEKNKLIEQKQKLEIVKLSQEQLEELVIEFIKNFLKIFEVLIKNAKKKNEVVKLMYQFRYFVLLPFNLEKNIKDIEKLASDIENVEKQLKEKAIEQKITEYIIFERTI